MRVWPQASFSMGVIGAVAEEPTGDVIGQALFGAIYAAVAGHLPISAAVRHRQGEEAPPVRTRIPPPPG